MSRILQNDARLRKHFETFRIIEMEGFLILQNDAKLRKHFAILKSLKLKVCNLSEYCNIWQEIMLDLCDKKNIFAG